MKKNVLCVVLLKMVISFLIEILLYDNQLLKNITILYNHFSYKNINSYSCK